MRICCIAMFFLAKILLAVHVLAVSTDPLERGIFNETLFKVSRKAINLFYEVR